MLVWIEVANDRCAKEQKGKPAKPDPAQQDGQPVKRGRGRPRKHPLPDQLPPSALAAFETAVPAPEGAEPPEEHETDYKHDEIA